MQHAEEWCPSKFVKRSGHWRATSDASQLERSSWLVAQLAVCQYERAVAQYARGRLLDLGCGKVPLYGLYREKVEEITCVDWASSLHGTKHLDLACDLNQPIPLPAGSFDTILFSDVLEHLQEPEHACREVARLLAPGGYLLMNVPFFYGIHEAPFDYYRYTQFGLRRLIERADLELISLDALGGIADIFADLSAKTMLRVPAFGRSAAWLMQQAAHTLGRTPIGARLRERSGQRTPLGYFLVARKAPSRTP